MWRGRERRVSVRVEVANQLFYLFHVDADAPVRGPTAGVAVIFITLSRFTRPHLPPLHLSQRGDSWLIFTPA